jgi:hypothetical protein
MVSSFDTKRYGVGCQHQERRRLNEDGSTELRDVAESGIIRYTRGWITVLDRGGLESAACECYFRIRDELDITLNGAVAPPRTGRRRTG